MKLELSYHDMHYHYWFLNQIKWALQQKIAVNEDSKQTLQTFKVGLCHARMQKKVG